MITKIKSNNEPKKINWKMEKFRTPFVIKIIKL